MKTPPYLLGLLALSLATAPAQDAQPQKYDLVIYGGTSAAIAAAVQAKRMNKTVIVVSPDKHLGGLSSGGLGWTDSGNKAAIGGISREFYQRIKAHYDKPESWVHGTKEEFARFHAEDDSFWIFEPRVAEKVFEDLVKEYQIPVVRDAWLERETGVKKEGARIVSIQTLDGKVYAGRVFMDATYEGDLLCAASVSYTIGREPNAKYGETLNGIQTVATTKHQFDYPVSAYRVPGDPNSGLLPRISKEKPGVDGEGDARVQAYNFRMCLTKEAANRVPFPKPEGYDADQYTLAARYLQGGWREAFRKFDLIPNKKTDTNNHGAFSTDNIGMNYGYPDGTYEERKAIIAEHVQYQQGLMYFLANDPSVPEDVRAEMSQWGLAKDEFLDNGHWPHQIYVREARRMVSDFVMTEMHLRGTQPTPDSVGMGSYNMDSHNVQRYVDKDGNARNEGDIQVSPGGPYPISYRAIVPKAEECDNLLSPVCLSSTHIAYGSIRMEPVFMILGQSGATAAALAIDKNIAVQAVDYAELKARLLGDKQVLEMERKPNPPKAALDPKKLPGTVLDDTDAKYIGDWSHSGAIHPHVGAEYRHDGNEMKGQKSATWETTLKAGRYTVGFSSTPGANRAGNVPVRIEHSGGVAEVILDQRSQPAKDTVFVPVGDFDFNGPAKVQIGTAGTTAHVVVDAVQFLPK